jgi:hypothetical protein
MAQAAKPGIRNRQMNSAIECHPWRGQFADDPTPPRRKPIYAGVRAKLAKYQSQDKLSTLNADNIRVKNLYTAGFSPLPDPNQAKAGMAFPLRGRQDAQIHPHEEPHLCVDDTAKLFHGRFQLKLTSGEMHGPVTFMRKI